MNAKGIINFALCLCGPQALNHIKPCLKKKKPAIYYKAARRARIPNCARSSFRCGHALIMQYATYAKAYGIGIVIGTALVIYNAECIVQTNFRLNSNCWITTVPHVQLQIF